ncbi:MAG: tRNA uridine-5-carboxymethylaminomethyl(34) synthesis enzyme MnmG [Sphaerochaetaceae bacterium]|nr:tRNA uridine-5-carboxymethylaminomethyl(34) synthesis enzyme MnmG [Candidatus Cloacimonadota bacterium]
MDYDAIVIGAGHAGIEASLALARLGNTTLVVTQNLDAIGRLSCNPAVGGLAKGNIVREIDALGGEMAHLIDSTMIQFRILNRRRGPAVQAPRAQADKFSYHRLAKETLEAQKNLYLFQDTVVDLLLNKEGNKVEGVITQRGHKISSKVVVMTTGTFMEGKIFIGSFVSASGRIGEPAAIGLGSSLRRIGFEVGRLKTGTPARVRKSSLNFDAMTEQPGDEVMLGFSFRDKKIERPTLSCWVTYTNEKTHKIIEDNMDTSPLYGGLIVGQGPRYCPSIEDKVVRFPDRLRHQIFVEPEGLGTEEMYLNGISTSLAEDVQEAFIHSVRGLEEAQIMRPGYAVEYDYLNPLQLYPSLETKKLANFYVSGQTNGTSGYEEAATQGLIAGINASLKLQNREPLILSRSDSYTGVLIDDLVTKGTNEPYRMFTSRAEHRLNMRHDTADLRLTPIGYDVGLKSEQDLETLKQKVEKLDVIKELLNKTKIGSKKASDVLRQPDVSIDDLIVEIPSLGEFERSLLNQSELDLKYSGYVERQNRQAQKLNKMEKIVIPSSFDYSGIVGLSTEGKQKLTAIKPHSVGQASRISGVRNSDIAILMVHLSRGKKDGGA